MVKERKDESKDDKKPKKESDLKKFLNKRSFIYLSAAVFSVTPKETILKSCLVNSIPILSLELIADVGISSMVIIGMTIRIAKITGMAATTKTTGFTIFIKGTFSQINLGKIT